MRYVHLAMAAFLLPQTACAQDTADEQVSEEATLVPDEEIFRAAGFQYSDGAWRKCGDPGTASYEAGAIMGRGDFNQDGLPDALVTEGSTYCFGMTGYGYSLVSQRDDGTWRIMDERSGIPKFLDTMGSEGWPDIEVGGPGFCFPVIRWNGTEYLQDRTAYEGVACRQ